jgi:hypothetical protein
MYILRIVKGLVSLELYIANTAFDNTDYIQDDFQLEDATTDIFGGISFTKNQDTIHLKTHLSYMAIAIVLGTVQ